MEPTHEPFVTPIAHARRRAVRSPPRVLLADDHAEMRDMVASALRSDGCHVTEVADGGRLLVRISRAYLAGGAELSYDLIITDVRMPVVSGLQILEGLRKARWTTPVILMTAFADDATRAAAEKLDAVLFDKPFDLDDLRTAVLNLV